MRSDRGRGQQLTGPPADLATPFTGCLAKERFRTRLLAVKVTKPVRYTPRSAVCPAGYRHQRVNPTAASLPGGTAHRHLWRFSRTSQMHEGLCYPSNRSRTACFFSCADAHVHWGGPPVCHLSWRLDQRQSPAGEPRRTDLLTPVPFLVQPEPHPSSTLVSSMMEQLGGWFSLWNSSASAMRDASLCQECRHRLKEFPFFLQICALGWG